MPVRRLDGTYLPQSLPKLDKYTEAHVDETVQEIDPVSIENLPHGLDNANCQVGWI